LVSAHLKPKQGERELVRSNNLPAAQKLTVVNGVKNIERGFQLSKTTKEGARSVNSGDLLVGASLGRVINPTEEKKTIPRGRLGSIWV